MKTKLKEHLEYTIVDLDKWIKLGKKIYELLPKCNYIYQSYRELGIKEQKGEKALKIYLAYELGKNIRTSMKDNGNTQFELKAQLNDLENENIRKLET